MNLRFGTDRPGVPDAAEELERNLSRVDRAAAVTALSLVGVIAGYVGGATPANGSLFVGASVLVGIGLAGALLGRLAGFLFGIPRLLTGDGQLASLDVRSRHVV